MLEIHFEENRKASESDKWNSYEELALHSIETTIQEQFFIFWKGTIKLWQHSTLWLRRF